MAYAAEDVRRTQLVPNEKHPDEVVDNDKEAAMGFRASIPAEQRDDGGKRQERTQSGPHPILYHHAAPLTPTPHANASDLEVLDRFISLAAAGAEKEEIIGFLSVPEKGEGLIKVIQSLIGTRQTGNADALGVKRERAESSGDVDDDESVEHIRGPGRRYKPSSSLVRLDNGDDLLPLYNGSRAISSRSNSTGRSNDSGRAVVPLLPNHNAYRGNSTNSSRTTSSGHSNISSRADPPLPSSRNATARACPPLSIPSDFLLGTSFITPHGITSPRKWLNSDFDTLVDHSMSFIAIIAANILTPTFPETQKRYIVLHFGNNDWSLLYVPSTVGLYKDPTLHFTFKEGTLVHLKNVFVHESKQRHLLKFTETSFIEKVDTRDPLKHCAEFNARLNAQHR
ncbi:nimEcyclinB [Pseudozyma hubeiensis SY62]|uniref:NimEcyclinB n=1 Tax=Pseudozyma hubeiensis (strain SY62) TaxID=1305764 RepID=R9NW44_PSEHS|nr:nimEcyclinB [Pseudozyma hubeiensis SY62]GAC92719.1 nimEcyclinB [Pseudozyma hubeiensis SY62]